MKKLKKLECNEPRERDAKAWRPALMGKGDWKALEAHNRVISRQVSTLFYEQIKDHAAVYVVRIPLGVGSGDPAALTPKHFSKVANWVRRRGSQLRKQQVAFGAGCIVPRLQTWGVYFRPRIELDLLLLVCVPLSLGASSGELVQKTFGGKVKLVKSGGKLGDIICGMREALEYPHIDFGDAGQTDTKMPDDHRARVVAVAKNFRELVRDVGVRRFWVFFGMRCNGDQVRRLIVTEIEKQARLVKAKQREARLVMLEQS